MDVVFVRSLIRDTVLVKPQFISSNYRDVILQQLQSRYDSACNNHGYVQSGSISIHKISLGRVESVSLNGDVSFDVQYFASICNPAVGSRLPVRVINMNKFGILAHSGVQATDGSFVPVVEAIITRHLNSVPVSDVNLDSVQVGDTVTIEIVGKKFELFERKIAVVARIVSDDEDKSSAAKAATTILENELGALNVQSLDEDAHSVIGSVEDHDDRVREDDRDASDADDGDDVDDGNGDGDGSASESDIISSRGGDISGELSDDAVSDSDQNGDSTASSGDGSSTVSDIESGSDVGAGGDYDVVAGVESDY